MSSSINEIAADEFVIFQGGNDPIMLQFPEDMSSYDDIHVILMTPDRNIWKHWTISELTFDDNDGSVIYGALSQEDTISFPAGEMILEVRAIDAGGSVHNYSKLRYRVIERNDKHILPDIAEEEDEE